jgi:hypothetical protein
MSVYDPRGSTPVHMDRVLTQMSLGWPNGEFVGPAFFPALPVRKQSDKYYVFGREAWAPPLGGDLRAPGSEAIDEEQENQDAPLNSLRDGTELITSQLLLVRELYIKNLITTAANFTSGHSVTLAGADQWSSAVSASNSPIGDHRLARSTIHSKIFLEPNTELIPYQVMAALEDHNEIIERIKYSERAILTPELMSNFFGGQRIIVPGVGYNTANPGQTAALGYIWGKDVVMAYVPPRPGMKIPAFGYEFVWSYPGGQQQLVERWRETVRVRDVVRVRRRYDIRFVAVDGSNDSIAGYLIKAAVA